MQRSALRDRDLSAVTTWLSGHGFSGIKVNAARTFIQFDGTAGMVRGRLPYSDAPLRRAWGATLRQRHRSFHPGCLVARHCRHRFAQ